MQPMALGDLILGNGDQAGNAGFRGQQVVVIGVQAARGQTVANVEDLALAVKQKAEVHLGDKGVGLVGQRFIAHQERRY